MLNSTRSVRASLEKKVATLERYASDGVPPGESWPRLMKDVAVWRQSEEGFTAWTKPNILAPSGPYPQLRDRLDRAIRTLILTEPIKKPAKRDAALQIAALRRERDALAAQVAELLFKLGAQEREAVISSVQAKVRLVKERNVVMLPPKA